MEFTIHLPSLTNPSLWICVYIFICYLTLSIITRVRFKKERPGKAELEQYFWAIVSSPVWIPLFVATFLIVNILIISINILSFILIGRKTYRWFKFN